MKLIEMNVKNYRGLRGDGNLISFEDTNLIFLIGNNNAGKSTFLKAYEFFIGSKTKAILNDFTDNSEAIPIEIIAKFRKEKDKTYPVDWIGNWVDQDGIITIKKIWSKSDKISDKYTLTPSTGEYNLGGFGGFDSFITKYAPTPILINAITTLEDLEKKINDIITANHIKKLESDYKEKYDKIRHLLDNLKEEITGADDIIEMNGKLNKQFQKIFPSLNLNIYSKPEEGLDITKTLKGTHGFQIDDRGNSIDINNNGHGVFRQALFSFLASNSNESNYIILYEEPELYLHPKVISVLKNNLYELASNDGCQVICATHSPAMIDLSKPHSSLVRLVKDDETYLTKTYQVKLDIFDGEDKNYLLMTNRFNPHLCESFYCNEVILVEGDTEAIIYRELIERYFDNSERNIFILNTGSKANMVFYQKILTHFAIKHTVVHDCDSEKNSDGRTNSMWTVNERIWNQIEESNRQIPEIAKRFVHFLNFEVAHSYEHDSAIGKPLSAYNYAKNLDRDSPLPCLQFLNDIFGENILNISQEELLETYNS